MVLRKALSVGMAGLRVEQRVNHARGWCKGVMTDRGRSHCVVTPATKSLDAIWER